MRLTIPTGNGKERHIGDIKNGIARKNVIKKEHLFKKLNAWGWDEQVFTSRIKPEATTGIEIYDGEEGYYYRTTVAVFEKFSIKQMPEYGDHRPQLFLPRNYFTVLRYMPATPDLEVVKQPCDSVLRFMYPERYEDKQIKLFEI